MHTHTHTHTHTQQNNEKKVAYGRALPEPTSVLEVGTISFDHKIAYKSMIV